MDTKTRINKLLEICPNYEKINSYEFFEGDTFSKTMINFYMDLISKIDMEDEEMVKFLNELDNALSKYVDDYRFRKFLKPKLKLVDPNTKYYTYKVTMELINNLPEFKEEKIERARWI